MVKVSAEARRKLLSGIIADKGIWALNKSKLAGKYGVSSTQINRDIKKIIKEIPQEDVLEIANEMKHYFKEIMSITRKNIKSSDNNIVIRSCNTLISAIKEYTSFLESFGFKDALAQKVDADNKFSFELVYAKDEDSLKESIRHWADKKELSVFDYLIQLLPGEISNHSLIRRWVTSQDDSWMYGKDFELLKSSLELKSRIDSESSETPLERNNSLNTNSTPEQEKTPTKKVDDNLEIISEEDVEC